MTLYENEKYVADVKKVAGAALPWDGLSGSPVVISGGTGMIGSFLADVISEKNREGLGCPVYLICRSPERAAARFPVPGNGVEIVFRDVVSPLTDLNLPDGGYYLHLASNTHPRQYATDPIGTIRANVAGLENMLRLAVKNGARRFAFASSNEIYGENRGDVELFDEKYCGYIDPNTMRAGYPESKRCGEALCQAYRSQLGLGIVIPRLTRTFGPTMLQSDTKAVSQFIKKGVAGEDIVLKSDGTQYYSFTYVADAVCGLLTVLLLGGDGEAYNVADVSSDITLRDLAGLVARHAGTKVVFEIPDGVEAAGYSKATRARLDGSKLRALGWRPFYGIGESVPRTIDILKETGAFR
ncbi:MAG: NAD-dependent epimerase/dehydratase family protein [Clostridia bacterium]|nr:NAD-dependent epimerase/dehydratase family protein [Clostridia bacterium]